MASVCLDGLTNILRSGLIDALGGRNPATMNMHAVIGRNAMNVNACWFRELGGCTILQNILDDPKAPRDLHDRAQNIMDAHFVEWNQL